MEVSDARSVVIRQSLSSGRAGLVRWSGSAFILPAVLCLVFAVRCLGDALPRALAKSGNFFVGLIGAILNTDSVLGLFALFGFTGAGYFFWRVVRARRDLSTPASDILINSEGFQVSGGPNDGLSLTWNEIDPEGLALTIPRWLEMKRSGLPDDASEEDRPPARFEISTREGKSFQIGRTMSAEDLEALDSLCELFENRLSPPDETPLSGELLRCDRCGATVPLGDGTRVVCPHCAHSVQVPLQMQARLRDHAEGQLADEVRTFVNATAHLPDAAGVNRIVRRLSAFVLIVGALIVAAFIPFVWCAAPNMIMLGVLTAGAVAIVYGTYAIGERYVVDRLIFELLGRHFGACPPIDGGDAWRCPACGAPLAPSDDRLCRCAYCGAHSIVGIDARLSRSTRQRMKIGEELETQLRRRQQAVRRVRFSVVAMGLGMIGLGISTLFGATAFKEDLACMSGDGRACYEISWRLHRRDASVFEVQSRPRAMVYAERSCMAKDRCGCRRLTDLAESEMRVMSVFGGSQQRQERMLRYLNRGLMQETEASGECYEEK